MWSFNRCKERTNFYWPPNPSLLFTSGTAPSVEILLNSQLKSTRCNHCTSSNCIWTGSWGCEEVKKVVLQPVQTAYKLLRARKSHPFIHRGIAPSMEILVNSGFKPTRCNDCTNANCVITERWGWGEDTKIVLQSVETVYKLLRTTFPHTPVCEFLSDAPFLDSGRSANWQTAHTRVGGVQTVNLEAN